MDDPGRHLDGSNCLDFHAHRLASLSQRSVNGFEWSVFRNLQLAARC
jgi:hypothetical protein